MAKYTEAIEPMQQIDSDNNTLGIALACFLALNPEPNMSADDDPFCKDMSNAEKAEYFEFLAERDDASRKENLERAEVYRNRANADEITFPRVLEEPDHAA